MLPGDDRSDANEWVTVAIPTGLGELRNGLIVRTADAMVAVGGAYGTLSEIALGLQAGLKVYGLHTWEIDGIDRGRHARGGGREGAGGSSGPVGTRLRQPPAEPGRLRASSSSSFAPALSPSSKQRHPDAVDGCFEVAELGHVDERIRVPVRDRAADQREREPARRGKISEEP